MLLGGGLVLTVRVVRRRVAARPVDDAARPGRGRAWPAVPLAVLAAAGVGIATWLAVDAVRPADPAPVAAPAAEVAGYQRAVADDQANPDAWAVSAPPWSPTASTRGRQRRTGVWFRLRDVTADVGWS